MLNTRPVNIWECLGVSGNAKREIEGATSTGGEANSEDKETREAETGVRSAEVSDKTERDGRDGEITRDTATCGCCELLVVLGSMELSLIHI